MSEEIKVVKKELDLLDIKGIGEKTKEKLIEKGVTTVNQLAVMRGEELADVLNITKKAGKDIVNDAKSKSLDTALRGYSFAEILKHKLTVTKHIPTGSMALDALLKGGISTEAITILAGEYSSGKTQLAYAVAIATLKMGRKVAWVETEAGTFAPDRLLEIAKASGVEIKPDDFYIIPASEISDPYKQFLSYEKIIRWADAGNDLGLVVIDSFSGRFRGFYVGREMLPDRSSEEARHFGQLDNIAAKYNAAILATAQVMDVPDAGGQLHQIMKTGTRKELTGGNILKHSGTYICIMQKVKTDEWELIVADSPNIPFSSARFRIMSVGIRDVTTRG